jgi:hypothetical protein
MDKVQTIINMTAAYYKVSKKKMLAKSYTNGAKEGTVIEARKVAMVLIREFAGLTQKQTGHSLGGRDHSTVIHAERSVSNLRETNKNYNLAFLTLKRIVRAEMKKINKLEEEKFANLKREEEDRKERTENSVVEPKQCTFQKRYEEFKYAFI